MVRNTRLAVAAIACLVVCSLAGTATADPPLDMPQHAQTITGEEAESVRSKLLPLVHDGKYAEAAKLARSEFGEQWCDVAIEGRWKVDDAELRRRHRLFGALTVLARKRDELDLAGECVITPTSEHRHTCSPAHPSCPSVSDKKARIRATHPLARGSRTPDTAPKP